MPRTSRTDPTFDPSADGRLEHAERQVDTLGRIRVALSALRDLGSADAIVTAAPRAACEACGFDRAAIYRVRGNDMYAEAGYVADDPELTRSAIAFSREHPGPLQDQIAESELVRRRVPLLVHDALRHPRTYKPLVEHYDTHAYVSAPIMPEGRVIGFINADRFQQRPRDPVGVDALDRDLLGVFAEGLGHVIERVQLLQRLRDQASEVEQLMADARRALTGHLATDVQLLGDRGESPLRGGSIRTAPGGDPELQDRLSRREREVLELLARGATNAQIARELFITEATTKAHVTHILRKLGARNRVEAASLFHRS